MKIAHIFLAAALLLPLTAAAGKGSETNVHYFRIGSPATQLLLDDVALNAAAAARTITLDTSSRNGSSGGGYAKLVVTVDFTWAAATTLTAQFTCSRGPDALTAVYARKTTRSCSSGTCTVYNQTDTYTTGGASIIQDLEYDIRGCEKVKVLFGGASAGASDFVDVMATGIKGD